MYQKVAAAQEKLWCIEAACDGTNPGKVPMENNVHNICRAHARAHNSRPSQHYGPRGTWETIAGKHQRSKHHCTTVFS